ncbi:hypothetical protein [Paraglaciecola psychrophila]|jgi:hypothetical protein|uniref:Uncharacterized protein n=1 Tax=Paraglaciecola psychrophila 170 TaxID=1129794 RepID=K7AJY1_9ALTE|nr:hypothetical protein [Paraglaciecola psychrophila]AGH46112.1 hypothetical protein C427_4007 [Paraglaciecola psychrophila 170]GAC35745.1 hypothetical protein GPSY_0103 [Paraglaciecola psychrophila 170]
MEISSSGAGSLAQIAPTQTGSLQQVKVAEQQATLETPAVQESQSPSPAQDQRVGSLVDVSV